MVNNRLGEIYFDKKKNGSIKILGHCYVKKEDYKTKQEQKWIEEDTKRVRVVYRNKKYKLVPPKIPRISLKSKTTFRAGEKQGRRNDWEVVK